MTVIPIFERPIGTDQGMNIITFADAYARKLGDVIAHAGTYYTDTPPNDDTRLIVGGADGEVRFSGCAPHVYAYALAEQRGLSFSRVRP